MYFYIDNRGSLSHSQIVFGPSIDPSLMALETIAIYPFLIETKSCFAPGVAIAHLDQKFRL